MERRSGIRVGHLGHLPLHNFAYWKTPSHLDVPQFTSAYHPHRVIQVSAPRKCSIFTWLATVRGSLEPIPRVALDRTYVWVSERRWPWCSVLWLRLREFVHACKPEHHHHSHTDCLNYVAVVVPEGPVCSSVLEDLQAQGTDLVRQIWRQVAQLSSPIYLRDILRAPYLRLDQLCSPQALH